MTADGSGRPVILIAGLTGRRALTPAQTGLVPSAGVGWLALG
jgi:hypothetical protein